MSLSHGEKARGKENTITDKEGNKSESGLLMKVVSLGPVNPVMRGAVFSPVVLVIKRRGWLIQAKACQEVSDLRHEVISWCIFIMN